MDFLHSIAHLGLVGWLIVAGAILFDFSNGWNDAGNAIATAVCTRVLKPAVAVAFGAVLNFLGAMWSSEVAKTVGKEIADPAVLTSATYLAALFVAPIWIGICSWRGMPISCSHSLMGALVGAVMATRRTVDAERRRHQEDPVRRLLRSVRRLHARTAGRHRGLLAVQERETVAGELGVRQAAGRLGRSDGVRARDRRCAKGDGDHHGRDDRGNESGLAHLAVGRIMCASAMAAARRSAAGR